MPHQYGNAKRLPFRKSFRQRKRGLKRKRKMFRPGFSRTEGYVGLEHKFSDVRKAVTTMSGTWAGGELDPTGSSVFTISGVPQNDSESGRDGRQYYITSVEVRGRFNHAAQESVGAPLSDHFARIILVLDKQTNGAQLNAEDVMLTVNNNSEDLSFPNLQFAKRFHILSDVTKHLPIATAGVNEGAINLFATGNLLVPFRMSYKFKKPLLVDTTGTSNVVANIVNNSLHIIGSSSSTVSVEYESRIRFIN